MFHCVRTKRGSHRPREHESHANSALQEGKHLHLRKRLRSKVWGLQTSIIHVRTSSVQTAKPKKMFWGRPLLPMARCAGSGPQMLGERSWHLLQATQKRPSPHSRWPWRDASSSYCSSISSIRLWNMKMWTVTCFQRPSSLSSNKKSATHMAPESWCNKTTTTQQAEMKICQRNSGFQYLPVTNSLHHRGCRMLLPHGNGHQWSGVRCKYWWGCKSRPGNSRNVILQIRCTLLLVHHSLPVTRPQLEAQKCSPEKSWKNALHPNAVHVPPSFFSPKSPPLDPSGGFHQIKNWGPLSGYTLQRFIKHQFSVLVPKTTNRFADFSFQILSWGCGWGGFSLQILSWGWGRLFLSNPFLGRGGLLILNSLLGLGLEICDFSGVWFRPVVLCLASTLCFTVCLDWL